MALVKKYGTILFLILLLVHCLCIYLALNEARTITKLLLVPFLLLYLFANSAAKPGMLVVCGLLLSFVGDLFLTRSGELFFLLGMLAFVGTHVCNSIVFYRLQRGKEERGMEGRMWILIIISVVVFRKLQPQLGSFMWPIIFYMVIINVMAILAARTTRNPAIYNAAVKGFIPGAILFVTSDAILAVNKFLLHEQMIDIVVMLTYGGAQYFLVKGFIKTSSVKPPPVTQ